MIAVVNANSLGRFHRSEKIDEISDRHNAIDQTKGGDLRPVLSGRNSEEQELIFPASPEQNWFPIYSFGSKGRYEDSGIKTHRVRREYGVKSTYGSHDPHLAYGKHNDIDIHRPIGTGYVQPHHSGYGSPHDAVGYGQHNSIHHQHGSGIKYPEHDHHSTFDHVQHHGSVGHHDPAFDHHGGSYGHGPTGHHDSVVFSPSHHSTEVGHHGSGYGRKY